MNVVSAGKAPWVISVADPPPALEISLLRETVILSWNQFVYAEGSNDEMRIAFASHDVVVRGTGLDPLLRAIADNRVALIRETVRSESFPSLAGAFIREIVVRKIEVE